MHCGKVASPHSVEFTKVSFGDSKNPENSKDSTISDLLALIDELLFQCANTMSIFKYGFEEIIATTKDIKDTKFYKQKNQ